MRLCYPLFLCLIISVLLYSCSEPLSSYQFVREDKCASEGVYVFHLDMSDSLAVYDVSIYSSAQKGRVENLELLARWIAPDGQSFSETVYMKDVERKGSRELYRSSMRPGSQSGAWILSLKPSVERGRLSGLGVICTKRDDGTR